ncbi:acetoacetate decarboxylase [Candidatus Berkiella aquae]|uniref:Acetoacetate decarboxylase n=1 Tax=Candidatus Berkiella aquae TaxID=295108 RepID=A0A0Q9YLR8_9GAMM|nr:acetoacetate decarboxylase [Candidatus Berkiella aquae]MCS5711591.1 acetoacetate decarboxylase [Candidatus Berkiella aquae]
MTDILNNEFSMPVPRWMVTYPNGPYRFINREFFIITYETDMDILREIVPSVFEIPKPLVKYEFIRMPDSTGFGDYTETGQVIPVRYRGEEGGFTISMFLDDHSPIAGGREIWGFPKKLAKPSLTVEEDFLLGTLDYGSVRVATATMGYKHHISDASIVLESLKKPIFLLKNIPDVTGQPLINQLTRTYLQDITVKGAWYGPGSLELHPHALAPVAQLPIRKIVNALHFVSDLTLPYGEVVEDFLKNPSS